MVCVCVCVCTRARMCICIHWEKREWLDEQIYTEIKAESIAC